MPALIYRLLADFVLVVHVAFVLFVINGLLLTLLGYFMKWQWVRNPWFRWLHLAAIVIVVLQAWAGVICPLTILENWLRAYAGGVTYTGSFIAYWLRSLLFYQAEPWVFTIAYSSFGALVIASWFFVKPRPFRKKYDG
jgi:hypothetical protein